MTPEVESFPTHRVRIIDVDNAIDEIRAFLNGLAAEGKRPWAEVFYPPPPRLTPEEAAAWERRQLDHFDAVELIGDAVVTLPPYAEMSKA